ncbi:DUF802 domain-containing protein [Oleiagrimonas sp. C23AA]|uniref:DUF802 domain-containing protein n=1 Tax=Oleiagrimonas sp. C23AA TaxID=2719047 RepID=UPI0014223B30|nr:DUF802 domain-containing protein [Oleiagrimonas sp. C23AA]NII09113.1 DUF802 domain-containing protein [Oleiagrimonas sp. C23AA]
MHKTLLKLAVFAAGLAAIAWIGVAYIGHNPIGAAIALVIGVCYLAGSRELMRYSQATAALQDAVASVTETPDALAPWLARVPASLRHAVRLRVEGERVALPAPTLTPYLVGLLVLLGMLGTLLGMMVTLHGTGLALESATSLKAIRGSIAQPVQGLGFAFGTSIAGVASSAMLGLLSALCRRERVRVVHGLDVKIAEQLRPFSRTHQREEAFQLLKRQTELMPTLVERLDAMMATLERQHATAGEQQLAHQAEFHRSAEQTYTQLADSVRQSLSDAIADSARATSAALQPMMETTLHGIAEHTGQLHQTLQDTMQRQLDGMSQQLDATGEQISMRWDQALTEQQRANQSLAKQLEQSLTRFADTSATRTGTLLDAISERLDASAERHAEAWDTALSRQESANAAAASAQQQAWSEAAIGFESRIAGLLDGLHSTQQDLQQALAAQDEARLTAWHQAFTDSTQALSREWAKAGEAAAQHQQAVCETLEGSARDISTQTREHASQTLAELSRLVESAQAAPAAVSEAFAGLTQTLSQHWTDASTQAATQQQAICDTLQRTAQDIGAQSKAHAADTIAEISQLVQSASEAPKAAADVVAEMRQMLSESMVRDTAMLEERSRLLETLQTLLDAVNHASTEQRAAVDGLVSTASDLLERVGARFTDHIAAETGKLEAIGTQVAGGTAEMGALGDTLNHAVAQFGQSNQALTERLQQIAQALDASLSRSDEQLAYYVAQAREVVDLSVLSQKQIIDDLARLKTPRASGDAA